MFIIKSVFNLWHTVDLHHVIFHLQKIYNVLFTHDYKVDANEMRDYMRNKFKLKKILAFDGGLSTSVNYKDIQIGSLGKYQRKVKSFLIIER